MSEDRRAKRWARREARLVAAMRRDVALFRRIIERCQEGEGRASRPGEKRRSESWHS